MINEQKNTYNVDISKCKYHYKGEYTNEDWCIRNGYGKEYCDCIKDCIFKMGGINKN